MCPPPRVILIADPDLGSDIYDLHTGLLQKTREAILGCVHAFEVHSPLEGESMKPSGICEG